MGEFVQSLVAQSEGGASSLVTLLFTMLPVVIVFYFMMLRPERKKQQEHAGYLNALKKGDEVVLTSGIIGKIQSIDEKTITVEVADKVRVRVLKVAVSGPAERFLAAAPAAGKALEGKKPEEKAAVAAADKNDKKEESEKKSA